ncbi:MAG: sensor histidine kinase [Planctomycetota bacterium]|jgi:signal transduction histidine kinase
MSRPWQVWVAFGLCLTAVLAAMGWISRTALRLERDASRAYRQAEEEGTVRVALWRMESALTPLLARESARPYFAYSPFYTPERAYSKMFSAFNPHDVWVPSDLLLEDWPNTLVHFQFGPEGELTSPQVPVEEMRNVAELRYDRGGSIAEATSHLDAVRAAVGRQEMLSALPQELLPSREAATGTALAQGPEQRKQARGQSILNTQEWQARNRQVAVIAQQSEQSQASAPADERPTQFQQPTKGAQSLPPSNVHEGVIKAIWAGDMLLLARSVSVGSDVYVQGCWLDWPEIKQWLLREIQDLLPQAGLEPVPGDSSADEARRLAALPVKLVPGELPAYSDQPASPIRTSLLLAWSCVLLAAGAVAALLLGTISLSERRAAFVSAVTHEMRTPLTTFRVYTEMLVKGMVPDEAKRHRYLDTLRVEADRLSHLVENVLAYARLERNAARARLVAVPLNEVMDRIRDRLADRAHQAGMELVVEADDPTLAHRARVDPTAIEQIVFNLVDNACKYAATGPDKTIHLEAGTATDRVILRVRDHGPGLSSADSRRLFRPFRKSARDAANSAPGVGLGLALSRRLARSMGGDLDVCRKATTGACFVLTLPQA